jgi:1,4-dihydroxy-2-naphthoate octaprenyltransferase
MNTQTQPSKVKTWITAVRPFAYTASVIPVFLGLAISVSLGYPIHPALFAITLLGVICFHTAANLLNDCFDHKRGLDCNIIPTSGAVVRGWLTERQVFTAAIISLAIGSVCGIILTILCGPVVLITGVIGTMIALGYTRSGFCFKYNALGDIVIFISFGMLPVFGTFWVQTQTFSILPILWSIPMCSYTVAILHANNWRDISTDKTANCKTIANTIGTNASRRYYRILMFMPYLITAIFITAGIFSSIHAPWSAAIVILSLPLAIKLSKINPSQDPKNFAMLDGRTAQLHLTFGILITIGIFLGKVI